MKAIVVALLLCALLLVACKKGAPPATPPPAVQPPPTPPAANTTPDNTSAAANDTLEIVPPATPTKAIGEYKLAYCNDLLKDLKSKVDKVIANIAKHEGESQELAAAGKPTAGKESLITELKKLRQSDENEYNTAVRNCEAAESKDKAACSALKIDAQELVDTLIQDFAEIEENMIGYNKSVEDARAANNQTRMTELIREMRPVKSSYDRGKGEIDAAKASQLELTEYCTS